MKKNEMKNRILIVFLILTLGCQTKKDMKERQKQMIENYVNSYNEFDINGMTKNLNDNIVFENISNEKVDLRTEGIKDFKKQAESAKQYFKQRKQTIESWEFNNRKVIIDIDYRAILAVDLPNGLKTGDTLELKGKSEFEFKDGKIVRIKDKS
jgi:ketosteroid isomerase-like protein